MAAKNNIYIFSDKIGAGKTTLLKSWVEKKEKMSGFLSPKIEGKRCFENIESGEKRLLEVENSTLQIGKYCFDRAVFSWAESELEKQLDAENDWLIIDEIGPLEIRKEQGFHHLILKIFRDNSIYKLKVLFVIRDFMVEEFIQKYQPENPKILSAIFFSDCEIKPDLLGITLCGGESKRMKSDKALLNYGNGIQWKKVSSLLKPFSKEVVISINQNQWKNWAHQEEESFVIDDKNFQNHGPLSGILSVIRKHPNEGLIILGTDFPLIEMKHLIQLNNERNQYYDAVCFENEGFIQPLVSIIEKKAVPKLLQFFADGNDSLRKFLNTLETKKIRVENENFLDNINTEEDFLNFRND